MELVFYTVGAEPEGRHLLGLNPRAHAGCVVARITSLAANELHRASTNEAEIVMRA